jgi:hypothetical protein
MVITQNFLKPSLTKLEEEEDKE